MAIEALVSNLPLLLISVILFVISGLPLYLAVKLFGGDTTLLKTALIMFVSGLVIAFVRTMAGVYGGIVSFIVLIAIYKVFFELGWISAFLAWITQFIILAFILLLAFLVVGTGSLLAFFSLA